jgi:hypothetical protein
VVAAAVVAAVGTEGRIVKFFPALIVLVFSILAGAFVSPIVFDHGRDAENRARDPEALRAEIRRLAKERALARFETWAEERSGRDDAGETIRAAFAARETEVDALGERIGQLNSGIEFAEALYDDPAGRVERDVAILTGRIIRDDLKMARLLLESTNPDMRRRAAGRLATAIREGSREAAELLLLLWSDPEDSVSSSARRSSLDLARRAKDNAELTQLMADSGLTDQLASRAASEDGRSKRQYLEALASLKHPAAEQGWVEIYNGAERDRDRVSAARALKDMGRTGPFDELLQRYGSELNVVEGRTARTAIDSLRRLGGPEAKLVLKAALDADPDGPNARQIQRTLRRIDAPARGQNRGGGRARGGR